MNSSTKRFQNKVIAITGSSTGIGLETALLLAQEGATLALSSSNPEKGERSLGKIKELSPQSFYMKCNVGNENEVMKFFSEIKTRLGRLDGAFNNAGIEGVPSPTHECTLEDFDRTLMINTRGVWLCMREEIKFLLNSPNKTGAIVNTSSVAGIYGISGMSAYVASKHAVNGLTKTAALELAGSTKIRVNAVCPGPIKTPMLDRFLSTNPEGESIISSSVPMKRIGSPKEVATAVLFLLSDEASYITGHELPVEGGWCA